VDWLTVLDGPGAVCLQGGREFGTDCLGMDAAALDRAGSGPVVVLAGAARVGDDYAAASARAVRHFRAAGAAEVRVAPDPRVDPAGCLLALADARLVALPGGSPSGLHEVVLGLPGVADSLRAVLARDGMLWGASAGAMVLGGWTVLPQARPLRAAAGFGAVPDVLCVAHYEALDDRAEGWAGLVAGSIVLGLPEASGVLVDRTGWTGLGERPCVRLVHDGTGWSERALAPADPDPAG